LTRLFLNLLLIFTVCSSLRASETDIQINIPSWSYILTDPNTTGLQLHAPKPSWITDVFGSAAFADSKGEMYAVHLSFEQNKPDKLRMAIQPFMGVSRTGRQEALITGIDGLLKQPIYLKGKFSLDFEGGWGFQQSGRKSFPKRGTHFNFRSFCGLSMRFGKPEKNSAVFGIRYIHSSNGGINSPNPGVDNLMLYTGFQIRF